jgi:large repetitive protein
MNLKYNILLSILVISILVPLYLANNAHATTPTQITLTTLKNPAFSGLVGFTAKVSPSTATGTVLFSVDGKASSPIPLVTGTAGVGLEISTPGTHQVTATYSGDSTYSTSTSTITQTITKITITVTSSQSPSVYGQPVTFTVTVSPSNAPGILQVSVANNPGVITWKSAKTGDGVYTYTTSQIPGGPHAVSASLNSLNFHMGFGGIDQVVTPVPTITSVTASPNPTTVGTQVKITAIVSPNAGGGVQFLIDGNPYGSAQGVGGSVSMPFEGGTHQVAAKFLGTQSYSPSTSSPYALTVNKISTTTIVHASVGSIGVNGITLAPQLKISVTVNPNLVFKPSSGTILLTIDGKTGNPAQINKGGYLFTGSPSSFTKGVHHFTATYSGDSNYMPSSSSDSTFAIS